MPPRSVPPPRRPVPRGASRPDRPTRPRKSVTTAFTLLVLTGWTGGHRFYLGRPWTGTAMAALSFAPFLAVVPIVADPMAWMSDGGTLDALTLAPSVTVMVWCLADAFRIRGWIRRADAEAEGEAAFGRGRIRG